MLDVEMTNASCMKEENLSLIRATTERKGKRLIVYHFLEGFRMFILHILYKAEQPHNLFCVCNTFIWSSLLHGCSHVFCLLDYKITKNKSHFLLHFLTCNILEGLFAHTAWMA